VLAEVLHARPRAPARFFAWRVGAPYDRAVVRIALVLLAVVGCASPMSALKEDNRRLAQTVSELRADRRAQERRLRDLQRQLDLARAQLVTAAGGGAVPELRVEVAAPAPSPASAPAASPPIASGGRVVGIADDGSEIVYEGDAAAGKLATLDDDPPAAPTAPRARPRPAETTPPAAPPKAAPPKAAPSRTASRPSRAPRRDRDLPTDRGADAGNDYRAAVELVKAGRHAEGASALRAFLGKHPRHDFADNAQYWLGEAYYAQKDYANALAEFRGVVETYPRGNKVPDALLKVGYCYLALGQPDKSRAVLEQVVTLYPKTEPAATAAKRLESL
jgi:tol-pal system protein YbgF